MLDRAFDKPAAGTFESFHCTVVADVDRLRIIAHGALDLATAPDLEATIRDVLGVEPLPVVIDLRRLTFIDSTGLKLLLRCGELARRRSLRFALIAGPPAVQRIFEVTGTLELFDFEPPSPNGRSSPHERVLMPRAGSGTS